MKQVILKLWQGNGMLSLINQKQTMIYETKLSIKH